MRLANVFDLLAKITLDDSEYKQKLGENEKTTRTFGTKLKQGLVTAGKVGAAAVGVVATGVITLGKKLVDGTREVSSYGDNIDKMSQKLGLSAEAYQEWDYVLGMAGADINSMSVGLKTLTNKVDEAKNGSESALNMFNKLGISLEDLNSMTREEIFESAIYGFQGMADSTERAALANDLFGRSGQELTPLFNSSIEDTKALQQAAHDLGFVMSNESVKAAADYNDALDTMQRTMSGVKRGLLTDFMPAITTIMGGITGIFSGDSSGGVGKIKEGISQLISDLSAKVPDMLRIGGQIVGGLLTAITENLPQVMSEGSKIILELVRGAIDNLPAVVDTGVQVIIDLVTGIGKALPELIPAAVSAVLTIVDGLLDNIDLLVDAALQLILGLAEGLINAIPKLIEKAPEIVEKLTIALIKAAPKILEAAFELIVMLIKGILDSAKKLIETGFEMGKKIGEGIGKSLSTVFEKGKQLGKKLKEGWDNAVSGVKQWATDLTTKIGNGISAGWASLKNTVSERFNSLVNVIKAPLNAVIGFVREAVEKLKNMFKFEWKLPKIKLPHFKVEEGMKILGITLPRIKVEWYKKAYDEPYMFNSPTVIGTAQGAKGFGDGAGGEMVYGRDNLMRDIAAAVAGVTGITINVYAREGQSAKEIALEVQRTLVRLENQRKAAALA